MLVSFCVSFCPLITLSDRVRYNSLRGAHDIHFNMSGNAVTQSDTAQPEQVIMFTPPSQEVMDKLGKDFVGGTGRACRARNG